MVKGFNVYLKCNLAVYIYMHIFLNEEVASKIMTVCMCVCVNVCVYGKERKEFEPEVDC